MDWYVIKINQSILSLVLIINLPIQALMMEFDQKTDLKSNSSSSLSISNYPFTTLQHLDSLWSLGKKPHHINDVPVIFHSKQVLQGVVEIKLLKIANLFLENALLLQLHMLLNVLFKMITKLSISLWWKQIHKRNCFETFQSLKSKIIKKFVCFY